MGTVSPVVHRARRGGRARNRGAAHLPTRVGERPARAIASCSSRCGLPLSRCCSSASFRPTLVLKAAVPQQNFLGVLLDDSRSMAIADRDGQPRSAFVQQQLAGPNGALLNALSQRFVLRFFRFSSSTDRVASAADSEVRRHRDAARPGARARARRARRPAARRPRDGHRRRRHVRRRASTNRSRA